MISHPKFFLSTLAALLSSTLAEPDEPPLFTCCKSTDCREFSCDYGLRLLVASPDSCDPNIYYSALLTLTDVCFPLQSPKFYCCQSNQCNEDTCDISVVDDPSACDRNLYGGVLDLVTGECIANWKFSCCKSFACDSCDDDDSLLVRHPDLCDPDIYISAVHTGNGECVHLEPPQFRCCQSLGCAEPCDDVGDGHCDPNLYKAVANVNGPGACSALDTSSVCCESATCEQDTCNYIRWPGHPCGRSHLALYDVNTEECAPLVYSCCREENCREIPGRLCDSNVFSLKDCDPGSYKSAFNLMEESCTDLGSPPEPIDPIYTCCKIYHKVLDDCDFETCMFPEVVDSPEMCDPAIYEGVFNFEDFRCYPTRAGGGSEGDPHFHTWKDQVYDFMGACDLKLLEAPEFDINRPLDINIRTKIKNAWSYIESVVVKIGEETLEVGSYGNYWLNGVEDAVLPATVAGYNVTTSYPKDNVHKFKIHISDREFIRIKTFKYMVSVSIDDCKPFRLQKSRGMMGEYPTGKLLARDGVTRMDDDPNALAAEWQIRDDEPMLFQTLQEPQFPGKCEMPEQKWSQSGRRRLGESIARAAAEAACSGWKNKEGCVHDVMATGDLELAAAGEF